MMNTVKYIAAGLVAATINPALAQVKLPNGKMTGPGMVPLSDWWGQDDNDGSGMVLGSAHQAPSGAYNIYIYTGNSPQIFLWGEVPLDPNIVPANTVQNKCQATLANVYGDFTYNYGYNIGDWPFPATIQMDGNQQINGKLFVNVYVRFDYTPLTPWTVYVIDLLCPPVPPPGGSND